MNYTIFGESHGTAIGVVLEGVPSGVEMDLEYALSNSLGFGGHNATLLVKKFEA